MKPVHQLCHRSVYLLLGALLTFALLPAQSDRPCGAPLLSTDQCGWSNAVELRTTAFQNDAPLSCPGNFTRDGWFRFVASAAEMTISRSVFCRGAGCAITNTAGDIGLALYEGDCNNLTVVEDCPSSCFLGIACVTAGDFMEAQGEGDHFTGLNVGQEYYLRVLWDSASAPPPDTLIVNLVNAQPCNLCLPCGLGFDPVVLDHNAIQLHGYLETDQAVLEWTTGELQDLRMQVQTSTDASHWQTLPGTGQVRGEARYTYRTPQMGDASPALFRILAFDPQGQQYRSNVVSLQGTEAGIRASLVTLPDGPQLRLHLPETGTLELLNLRGQVLHTEILPAGTHQRRWTDSNLPGGMYLLKVATSTQSKVLRLPIR